MPTTANWKPGKAADLGDTHFRSAWERNYARYLNYLVSKGHYKSWAFEPETFWFEGIRRGTTSYKPDFRVVKNDGSIQFHEIKGWFDSKSKTKLKRMKKYHPTVVIILVDGPAYKSIAKYGPLFSKHWER